ncbi:MAG: tetratricopeptide (TPR) repeat protein [Gammaproteobacteria bacterium]|jgi:tetratricopeptide (TPR) repeat protein
MMSTFTVDFFHRTRVALACSVLVAMAGTFSPTSGAQNTRGACIGGSGASAAAACEQAIRGSPDDADLYLAWVDRLLQAARIDDADGALRKGLSRFPSNSGLQSRVAVIKSHLAEQKFLQERKRARSSGPRSSAMARRDQLKCMRNTDEAALTACNRLIEDDGSNAQALARKASILLQTGRYSEASEAVQVARQAGASESALRSVERLLASRKRTQDAARKPVVQTVKSTTKPARPAKPARVLAAVERKLLFDPSNGAFRLR